jgi:DNA polymerase-4
MMEEATARRIGHLDMDAFFAAVEQLDDPACRGRPVIVGGLGPRGVVSTASYEAREFGIHSAMPMALARKRCPDGVYLVPRFRRYKAISDHVLSILRSYSPLIETVSLDEAFFDLSHCTGSRTAVRAVAEEIKRRVHSETNLTCSVGIAPNRFLAKLASELDKPNGLKIIESDQVQEILDPLRVNAIWGVGEVTERRLKSLGLLRVRDLRLAPLDLLAREFGAMGRRLHGLARGEDETPLCGEAEAKSISREVTYSYDLADPREIEREVRRLAGVVASRLQADRLLCRTIRIKIRYPDFRTISRQVRLGVGTDATRLIEAVAVNLLNHRVTIDERGVRLVGVGVGRLSQTAARQLPLF